MSLIALLPSNCYPRRPPTRSHGSKIAVLEIFRVFHDSKRP
jgi:hypothetical protein